MFIAEDEKLVIDCLLHPEKLGNTDEIIKAIKKASIDKDKITSYLNKINNKSLNKRAGFLLEKYKGTDLSGKIRHKDKNHVLLTPYTRGKHISRKWMVKHDLD